MHFFNTDLDGGTHSTTSQATLMFAHQPQHQTFNFDTELGKFVYRVVGSSLTKGRL